MTMLGCDCGLRRACWACGGVVVKRPVKGRVGKHQSVFLFLAGVTLRQRVAVGEVGVLNSVKQPPRDRSALRPCGCLLPTNIS
jgi:hypothetical protein